MKRLLLLLAAATFIVGAVVVMQRLDRDRQYRALLGDGERALAAGESHIAIESFSGALALRADSMVAHYRRGEAYRQQRQDDKAVRDLREANRLAPEAPEPLVALGQLYDQRGEPARAAEWYAQAAHRLKDADPALLYSLALALYKAGSPAAARDPLRSALNRDDSLANAHYLLGLVYRDAQDLDSAVIEAERAVKLAPGLLAAREELSDLYRALGRPADEQAQLEALKKLDQQVDRDIALALADLRQGRSEDALARLRDADETTPNDSRIALATGRVLLARAEGTDDRQAAARALAALDRALGGTARRSEGLALFGRALFLSGQIADAERILQGAVATSPVDAEAFGFLADASERLGHAVAARDALLDLDALEGDTASPEVRAARARRIGALSIAANDPKTALTALTHAVDAGIADATTLGLLARARWRTGDLPGARAALERAMGIAPDNRDLQRLAQVIR